MSSYAPLGVKYKQSLKLIRPLFPAYVMRFLLSLVNTILLGTYVVLVLSTTFKGIPFNQWQQTFIQDPSILFQGWNAYLI